MSAPISELNGSFIPVAVLAASFVGSLHCAGMCGPLVTSVTSSRIQLAAYHLGRLLSYVSLGFLAGAVGGHFLIQSHSEKLSWMAVTAMAMTFVALGVSVMRGKPLHLFPMKIANTLLPSLLAGKDSRGVLTSATVGALSAFLPCGWLHSFVLAAASTSSGPRGALFLAFFWAGTLPAVSLAPGLARVAIRPLLRIAPKISGGLLILAGIASVGLKMAPHFSNRGTGADSQRTAESCH